jgi:hypothetical protein
MRTFLRLVLLSAVIGCTRSDARPAKTVERAPEIAVQPAPIPEPFAVLDLGPPPKGLTADERCKRIVTLLTSRRIVPAVFTKEDGKGGASTVVGVKEVGPEVLSDPAVHKLPRLAKMSAEEVQTWLRTNLKVEPDGEVGRIRLKFSAGSRAERVVILNGLLRAYEHLRDETLTDTKVRIRANKTLVESYCARFGQDDPADNRAEIEKSLKEAETEARDGEQAVERLKQTGVRKWAK